MFSLKNLVFEKLHFTYIGLYKPSCSDCTGNTVT